MTSKQIECFLSVANTLNFSHSANELYSSQSTVSRQIRLLEEELGFELFVRGNNYVRLTSAGITMLSCFLRVSQDIQHSQKTALLQSEGASGFLKLGFYSDMFIEDTLISIIQDFHRQYPHINLTYECIPYGNLSSVIREQKYDLVFLHDFDELSASEFVTENIFLTYQYLIYGKSHPCAQKENLSLLDFKDDIFWAIDNRTSAKREDDIKKIMNYYNIEEYHTETAPNFETVMLNIRLGNGVCFLDPITHQYDLRYYDVLALPEDLSRIGINVTWLKDNQNAAIPLFINRFIRQGTNREDLNTILC